MNWLLGLVYLMLYLTIGIAYTAVIGRHLKKMYTSGYSTLFWPYSRSVHTRLAWKFDPKGVMVAEDRYHSPSETTISCMALFWPVVFVCDMACNLLILLIYVPLLLFGVLVASLLHLANGQEPRRQ